MILVIGAGRMGQGIAQAFAVAGQDVGLVDRDPAIVETAIERIRASLQRAVQKGAPADSVERVRPASMEDARGADLVIEAVFEDREVKRQVLQEVSAIAAGIIATNTSSFQVAELASDVERPERFVAMHFFFPAHRNRLLEIAGGSLTDKATLEQAVHWGELAGKDCIVVADGPGFCVNRFLLPYADEACRLLDEGHDPGTIEASGAAATGTPYGPFGLIDLSGVAVCHHAIASLYAALPGERRPAPALERQLERGEPFGIGVGQANPALTARLRRAYQDAARQLVEAGIATPEQVDHSAEIGLAWPVGPFAQPDAPETHPGESDTQSDEPATHADRSEPAKNPTASRPPVRTAQWLATSNIVWLLAGLVAYYTSISLVVGTAFALVPAMPGLMDLRRSADERTRIWGDRAFSFATGGWAVMAVFVIIPYVATEQGVSLWSSRGFAGFGIACASLAMLAWNLAAFQAVGDPKSGRTYAAFHGLLLVVAMYLFVQGDGGQIEVVLRGAAITMPDPALSAGLAAAPGLLWALVMWRS